MSRQETAIPYKRSENYSEWYQHVIKFADLAEISPVRGCMTIKPLGYGIWQNIQDILNERLKATGHHNYYFPLFIPLSFLEKESEHIEGFAKECAVVTHHRLEKNDTGQLIPVSPLEEPLIVRPTSETIIGEAFSRWIHSYRDLPLLMNQWANIIRWELRTRIFLRTTEFLWQEGHTAHATEEEAQTEALQILNLYADFCENILAIPVIKGKKTESERFPGAVTTYSIEAMMQDGKALQAGTSHFLGQNFAQAFNIQYLTTDNQKKYCWTTSWGVTTRLIGALIMVHSDDDGLVLPPRIAPQHVIISSTFHRSLHPEKIIHYCHELANALTQIHYHGKPLSVEIDQSDHRPGDKMWNAIKKGFPIRIEIGPRELESLSVSLSRRDQSLREIHSLSKETFLNQVIDELDSIQFNLFHRAQQFLQEHTHWITTQEDLYHFFETSTGFAYIFWNEEVKFEEQIKNDLGVTIRSLPLDPHIQGPCLFTQKKNSRLAIVAKAY